MESKDKLGYKALSSYKSLFLDYVYDFARLSTFFPGDPGHHDSWRQAAKRLDAFPGDRALAARALRRLNSTLEADAEALRTVDELENGALVVITGQQVGLFGGPLYTLYKALTAVELARRATSLLNRPVVPLFWMDSDDHDFDEVRHARVLDRASELITLSYDPAKIRNRIPVAWHKLQPTIEEVTDRADASLAPTEFKQNVIDVLRECYTAGETMCAAFGRLLLRMTRGTGLAVVDPADSELKSAAAALFERETAERSESSRIVHETTKELVDLGYHAQAGVTEDRLNLFYAAPGRFHIMSENSGFRIAADGRLLRSEELQKLIQEEPERFSPNVLLRPLYQDFVFPTLAYVAGPNELAYFAQLGGVYRHFGVTMPLIAPRASFTIIERPQKKFIKRYEVELRELAANDESLLNRILKKEAPPQLEEDMSKAKACVHDLTQTLERDLAQVDPTLVPTVRSTRGKLLHALGTLETKSLRAIKRKDETLRHQFFSTRKALFPNFSMQERQLSPIQYLGKYGWHFSEMIRSNIDADSKEHVLLYP
jgi:bacillithiol biosynthesis cysteine-adding enzyme BshC